MMCLLKEINNKDYMSMRLDQHGGCKTKFRIYGVIAKKKPDGLFAYLSVLASQRSGKFSFKIQDENNIWKPLIVHEEIDCNEPHQRRQRLRFKIRGRVQYAGSFINWLWSGDSADRVDFGDIRLMLKTREVSSDDNFSYIRCVLRDDIK